MFYIFVLFKLLVALKTRHYSKMFLKLHTLIWIWKKKCTKAWNKTTHSESIQVRIEWNGRIVLWWNERIPRIYTLIFWCVNCANWKCSNYLIKMQCSRFLWWNDHLKLSFGHVHRLCHYGIFFFTSSVFFTQFQVYARQPLLLSHFMAHKQLIVQFNCIFYGYEIV